MKRGEEEINEIIGRAGGQGGRVGPYTGELIDHAHVYARARTYGITMQQYVRRARKP